MIDPEKVYNTAGNAGGEQDPPPHAAEAYLQARKSFPLNTPRAGGSFKVEGVAPSDQAKFFGETGIFDPALSGQDIALEAGNRQTTGNKIVRRLGNLVPNIAANIVDMAGSTAALITEWGDERDYQNGLTELADSMKNPAGENYKRSNDTWAIGDPTWWIDNIFNTAEYAGAYALGGVGVAKGLGAVAESLGTVLGTGARATDWLNKAAQLGTSGFVSYAQGASDGAQVFQEVYDNQFRKALASGESPEQAARSAKHIAAQSAATTAQLSTMLTMAINSGAYAPVLKSQQAVMRDIIGSRVAAAERGTMQDIIGAIRGLNAADYADRLLHHQGIRGVLNEMWKEGGEEVLQQFAQRTGADIGNKGQMKGFLEQFGEMENLIDRTANSEGLLAFTLGAAFGGMQHGLIHNVIPSRHVEKYDSSGNPVPKLDKQGNPMADPQGRPIYEKHWVSPRTYEKDFTQRSFDTIKDTVAHDFEQFDELKTDYLEALKNKKPLEADGIRDEMFNTGKLYAVKAGMTKPWIKTFEGIANLTPEQAVEAGYAEDVNDESYKERAQEAITDLGHLSRRYEALQKQYGTRHENNPGLQPLVDMVFARETDLYQTKKRIDRYRKELEEDEHRQAGMAWVSNPEQVNLAIQSYIKQHNSATEVARQLNKDLETLKLATRTDGVDSKIVDRLLKKYRAIGFGVDNRTEAIKDLVRKLSAKHEHNLGLVQAAESGMLMTPEYQTWLEKTPEGSFDEYLQEANKSAQLSAENRFKRAQLDEAQAQYEIAQQNLQDMTSEKNANRFMRKVTEWRENMIKEAEQVEKTKAANLARVAKDKATLTRLERIGANQIAEKYRADRDSVYERISMLEGNIRSWQSELKTLRGDALRGMSLKRLINNAEKEIKELVKRATVLDSLYRENYVDLAPEEDTMEPEDVDGTDTGKILADATEAPTTGTALTIEEMTPEQFLAELESGGPVASSEYSSIEDEMEALARRIEGESEQATGNDPIELFQETFKGLVPLVQKKLQLIVDGQLSGEFGHSLDALNPEIAAGLIETTAARAALIAARDYVEEVRLLTANKEPEGQPVQKPEITQDPQILVTDVSAPDTPPVETDEEVTGRPPVGKAYHAGYKIIEAAHTGATSTIGYEEGIRKVGRLTKYIKVTKPGELNPTVSKAILDPKGLKPGHPLRYEVDTEYDGPKLITDDLSWDENQEVEQDRETSAEYLDEKGRVKGKMVGGDNAANEAKREVIKAAHNAEYRRLKSETTPGKEVTLEELIKAGNKFGNWEVTPYGETLRVMENGSLRFIFPKEPSKWDPEMIKAADYLRYIAGKTDPKPVDNSAKIEALKKQTDAQLAAIVDSPATFISDPYAIGNVPIRVLDGVTGEFLFHIRKMDWINARFPGATNHRNVVESTDTDPDNIGTQRRLLLQLRTAIVNRFNADGSPSEGRIAPEGKGTGRLILNQEIKSKDPDTLKIHGAKVVPRLAYNAKKPEQSMLPDDKLELVIVGDGNVPESGRNYASDKKLGFDTSYLVKGAVGALVPAVNGEYMYAPLIGMKLVDPKNKISPALNSVTRAIELYLLNDGSSAAVTNEIADIEKKTNFNVGTARGLRAFINQYYTYLQNFNDSALSPNNANGKSERFVFNVDDSLSGLVDKTKQIKVGFTARGGKPEYANLVNGTLSPKFVEVLREGFAMRSRAVVFTDPALGIKGINSQGVFHDINYVPGKGWKQTMYMDYNEYVKSFSKTPVYGRNRLEDGTYVYTANPHLPITDPPAQPVIKPNTSTTEVKAPTKDQVDMGADLLDRLGNFSPVRSFEPVQELGSAPDNARPLTLATLQEKYNFTPDAQRNGKTVLEVWDSLTGRGHTFLPDGFNPFSRCL